MYYCSVSMYAYTRLYLALPGGNSISPSNYILHNTCVPGVLEIALTSPQPLPCSLAELFPTSITGPES